MNRRVVAIGLDAADPELLERWIAAGLLPELGRLRARGAWGRLASPSLYRTETSWSTLLSGASAAESGEWGHVSFDPGRYEVHEAPSYDFASLPPFYARLPGRRVATFDVPLVAPVPGVDGIQLCGWGTETNQCLRRSEPPALIRELLERHGPHPLFAGEADHDGVVSYRVPSAYDGAELRALAQRLAQGAETRGEILCSLLERGPWDLLLGVFSETHTAGHLLWHLSQPHPLNRGDAAPDAMLTVFQAVDAALGRVLDAAPDDATIVVFSGYGLAANGLDLPSMAFLPEWLQRWNTGIALLEGGDAGDGYWPREMAALATVAGRQLLRLPGETDRDPLDWLPAWWYRDLWPRSRAFALPTYADGLVRLNVAGREGRGVVAPEDYVRGREVLATALLRLRCGHCGRPMVRALVRTRQSAFDEPHQAPPADLVVLWEEHVTDRLSCPVVGTIGPFPYFRTGGHVARGFALIAGAGAEPGGTLPAGQTTDLTATLLALASGEGEAPLITGTDAMALGAKA